MKQTFALAKNKKKLFLTLLPIMGLALTLLGMVLIPGKTFPTFARPICDAGWQYDIESTGLRFKPLSDSVLLRNPYDDKQKLDFAVTKTKTVEARFEAGLEVEAGLLFEKVKAKFGVTLSRSTSKQTTVTAHYVVPPHTTLRVTYEARINSYQVHKYFLSQGCTTSRDSYRKFSAPSGEEFIPKKVKI